MTYSSYGIPRNPISSYSHPFVTFLVAQERDLAAALVSILLFNSLCGQILVLLAICS